MLSGPYFSLLKDSLIELVKKSTDIFNQKEQIDRFKSNFYHDFLNNNSIQTCKITGTQTIPRVNLQRSYAVYCIQISTNDLTFVVKKRYSEFQNIYHCINKQQPFENEFPKKTIFQSGSADQITRQRLTQLNKILEQLNKESISEQIKFIFFDFIQLYDHYQQQGILQKTSQTQVPTTDDFLLLSITRLNEKTKHSIEIFSQIKLSISERKRKITYELAKSILIGYKQNQGLLSFVINSNNQIILVEGLKIINWLFSAEMNRDYQIFGKVLQKCMPSLFILEQFEDFKANCDVQVGYFKLLRIYLQVRQDLTIFDLDKYFQKQNLLQTDYNQWLKYYNYSCGS